MAKRKQTFTLDEAVAMCTNYDEAEEERDLPLSDGEDDNLTSEDEANEEIDETNILEARNQLRTKQRLVKDIESSLDEKHYDPQIVDEMKNA